MFSLFNHNAEQSANNKDQQITKSCRIKYPNMIPIKVQAEEGIKILKDKFLISEDVTGLQLQRHILKYVQREISQGLYFFIVDKSRHRMLQSNVLIKQPYRMYKNQTGFMVLEIMKQNVF